METSEVVVLGASTPAGTAGTLTANTLYDHPVDTPLYAIKYDQVVFERSTAGTTGTASPMTNGTVTIQADNQYTIFDDTTGATSYVYRTYFRNSVTGGTTSESDWQTSSGFSYYSLAKMRQRVRRRLYDSTFIEEDEIIDDWINEYLQMMNNTMVDVNEDYALGTVNLSFSNNQELGTISNTDFRGGFKRVWFADGSGTYQATKMDSNTFYPTRIFSAASPYYYMQGDTVIGRKPFDAAGTLQAEYYKFATILVNDTDVLPQPMWDFTKGFIDYAQAQALAKDSKFTESQPYEAKAMAALNNFKIKIAPRNVRDTSMINIVESLADDQGMWF